MLKQLIEQFLSKVFPIKNEPLDLDYNEKFIVTHIKGDRGTMGFSTKYYVELDGKIYHRPRGNHGPIREVHDLGTFD